MPEGLSDEQLRDKANRLRGYQRGMKHEFTVAYVIGGVGIVLLLIGWANYEESWLGIFALIGLLALGVGVTGYFVAKGKYDRLQKSIDETDAILRDRRRT